MSRRVGLIVGGVTALGASVAAFFLSRRHVAQTKDAVQGVAPPMASGGSNPIVAHLTHYYPFDARTDAERKMEGAPTSARWADHKPGGGKRLPLYTVEDFLAGKAEYVSLAGDYEIWPWGQKILVPWGDKQLVGRVVDTGGHFHGSNKVFRVLGAEPIDVCVFSRDNHPPKSTVDVQVVVGDHFEAGAPVAQLDKVGKPQVTGLLGLDLFTTRSSS